MWRHKRIYLVFLNTATVLANEWLKVVWRAWLKNVVIKDRRVVMLGKTVCVGGGFWGVCVYYD